MHAVRVDGQIGEGDVLTSRAVGKRREVNARWAHLATVIVHPRLPADKVLDLLNDELSDVVMLSVIAGGIRAESHRIGCRVVAVAHRDHIQTQPRRLNGSAFPSEEQEAGRGGGGSSHDERDEGKSQYEHCFLGWGPCRRRRAPAIT